MMARKNIVVSQDLSPSDIPHGSTTEFIFKIHNDSFLQYPHVRVNFKYVNNIFLDQLHDLNLVLHPDERHIYKYEVQGKYRGQYVLGADEVIVYDILNIFKLSIKPKDIRTLTVLPKVARIQESLLNPNYLFTEFEYDQPSRFREDSLKDIRDYQKGDSLKNIHWKLYAKFDKLMVKEKENSAVNKTMIFLDTKQLKGSFVNNIIFQDKLLEAYLSTLLKVLEDGHVLDIGYKDHVYGYDKSFNFEHFFNEASIMDFDDREELPELINSFIYRNYHNKNLAGIDVFIFTMHNDKDLQKVIQDLSASSVNVHIVQTNPHTEEKYFMTDNSVRYYQLEPETNISELVLRNMVGDPYAR